jgi:membrane-associated protease RseP (regulator of RpoE activity)
MTLALEALGWLIFLIGIGISIGLHEIGHLVPAKAFGVKVTQYMVGFGPTAWARRRGETEYGVKWIPLGGYIRMVGMYAPERGADPSMLRASTTGRFTAVIEDARRQSMEEVGPADADRVFYKLPVRKRIVVMLGGPFMNLALALVLFTIVLSVIGIPQVTTTVGRIVPCVPTAASTTGDVAPDGSCPGSEPTSAAKSDLQVGDVVVAVDGQPIDTWEQAQATIRASDPGPTPIVVARDGEEITLVVPLSTVEVPTYDDNGNATGETEERVFLGVSPGFQRVTEPVTAVPGFVWETTVRAVTTIVTLPARMVDLVRQVSTDEARDPNGIVGPVGVGRIAGEVVALEDTPVIDKTGYILGLLAGVNLFLFLFNLIPLLPLDGGHVAGAVWESIKRGWARMRNKPDPGPVDIAKALPLTYVVSIGLIAMGGVILLADLIEPIRIS